MTFNRFVEHELWALM